MWIVCSLPMCYLIWSSWHRIFKSLSCEINKNNCLLGYWAQPWSFITAHSRNFTVGRTGTKSCSTRNSAVPLLPRYIAQGKQRSNGKSSSVRPRVVLAKSTTMMRVLGDKLVLATKKQFQSRIAETYFWHVKKTISCHRKLHAPETSTITARLSVC